jgi:hypothetical protein
VRQVKRLTSETTAGKIPARQQELFTSFDQWRYHAVSTDSPPGDA